ncbi:SusC/RagA family TonB-linked outer membrane protein [Pedobacter sp. PLR]|uniref:SusC/RagA family TonB-linked outer membrane protein n=1 Tax=Pedobacter sp. PLR TaxID=2994465 RepID=UPI002246D391|nr:SusC/RagA family TonB-linked outer membrane protein [Pedobacter sp. PLR]MCX2454176.1 SusC/RagA family TonB-linked outer membrane protein [Pedobacter sp. PLR]
MKKTILLIVVAALCLFFNARPQKTTLSIKGKILDEKGMPIPGTTITVKGEKKHALADHNGQFTLNGVPAQSMLIITCIGYQPREITNLKNSDLGNIILQPDHNQLKEVEVVSTGFQNIPKERATGSFTQIDNSLLNRSLSTDILSRLNGVTSGLIFNSNGNKQFRQSNIEIRGRATLFSNPDPLIIVDNFPYDGDLSNINPNDVESITILKDAAAASAWGSRSGNGVIVITTKKGALNAAPTISINTNLTVGRKPDLYDLPQLSSSEYIDIEQFLFRKGAYNGTINNGYAALSPAVEIFLASRNKTISKADSIAQIDALKGYDAREQLLKYYYRPSLNQQYQASVNGGSASQKYFVSAGYDKNLSNTQQNSYNRVTLNASNTYYFLKNRLELFSNIIYTGSVSKSAPGIAMSYPYDRLADAEGNPLIKVRTLRPSYASTAGNGKLLNWLYKPLDELNNGYSATTSNLTDYRINLSLSYTILKGLKAAALYSYEKGISETNTLNELESYYTRDLINTYTQINPTTQALIYPIPYGGILNTSLNNLKSHNGRIQMNYDQQWDKHSVNAITGVEVKDFNNFNSRGTLYGYFPETATNQNAAVNYTADNPIFYNPSSSGRISPNSDQLGTTNRFFSYYFNGAYTYAGRYIASISARKDESNLFGVATNLKGVPLWSAGLAWVINKEAFYDITWLPQLKLRATYGYTGNVNNSISAYLTARGGNLINRYDAYSTEIVNPPNPGLRWERIRNLNLGIDFSTKAARINGSIDFWKKKGIDLIGSSPIAPQTGISLFTGNSANTLTKGVDIQVNSNNLSGNLKWYTTLLYNYSQSKVTDYKVNNGSNSDIVTAGYNNPLIGYPYYSIFSYKYAGLDSKGNPQGYLNGEISTDYTAIRNSLNRDDLKYSGSAIPTSFGSLRNTFIYRAFDFSFNIIYKFGYYFRRNSLENSIYSINGNNYQVADYQSRWQNPGDELITQVPALVYPNVPSRYAIYTYSEALIEKGDHLRLQDIRLGYNLNKRPGLPFNSLSLFVLINNIGVLWKANKQGLDPDYPRGISAAKTISMGLKAIF